MKCSAVIWEMQLHFVSITALRVHWMTHWLLWKKSMGNSQLAQWNFHCTFRSSHEAQSGENSSLSDVIQWKHHGHHDLQTTTKPLNLKVHKLFPRYIERNSAGSMSESQPQQLIKSCWLSVDHAYLLAAVILWWWNCLDSWSCTTYLPLRHIISWQGKTILALC